MFGLFGLSGLFEMTRNQKKRHLPKDGEEEEEEAQQQETA